MEMPLPLIFALVHINLSASCAGQGLDREASLSSIHRYLHGQAEFLENFSCRRDGAQSHVSRSTPACRKSLDLGQWFQASSFALSALMTNYSQPRRRYTDEFPAVTVPPSLLKAGASLAIFSIEVSMGRSSTLNIMGSPFF